MEALWCMCDHDTESSSADIVLFYINYKLLYISPTQRGASVEAEKLYVAGTSIFSFY